MLHDGMVNELEWNDRDADEFEEEDVCDFVANLVLYTHGQYRKRLAKGHRFSLEKLRLLFENGRIKKKLRISAKKAKKAEKTI